MNHRRMFAALLLTAVGCGAPAPGDLAGPPADPTDTVVGQTTFQSVALPSYGSDNHGDPPDVARVDLHFTTIEVEDRTILVHATAYGGVQIVDLRDPASPILLAGLEIDGRPEGLYAMDDMVVLLARRWDGGASIEVSTLDLSDPNNPTVVGHESLEGDLRGNEQVGDRIAFHTSSAVGSIGVAPDGTPTISALTPIGDFSLLLPSTSPDHFVVARRLISPSPTTGENNRTPSEATELLVFDAAAVQHGTTTVGGPMHTANVYQDVLRVAFETSHTGSFTPEEVVRTFDISDLANIRVLASASVRDPRVPRPILTPGRALYGHRMIPISADGALGAPEPTAMSWSHDNWSLVSNQTRLLVVESDAVSLYDVEQPTALSSDRIPSISGSFGSPRVLENAASITAADGVTTETGLLIVPHQKSAGWNTDHGTLELMTFSDSTVTRRGAIPTYAYILGAVAVPDGMAVLTGGQVSVQDLSDIAAPSERARLDLVPTITNVFEFGGYLARRHADFNYGAYTQPENPATDVIRMIRADDWFGQEEASFTVPALSILRQVGSNLVATSVVQGTNWDDVETTIEVWDLSDPLMPLAAPSIITSELSRDFAGGLDQEARGYHFGPDRAAYPVRDALIYVEREVTQIGVTDTTPFQSWATVQLHPLDLRDATDPRFGAVIDIDDRVLSILPDGSRLHVTTWEDVSLVDGTKRHFLRTVDFDDLDAPTISDSIEVSGRVLHIADDIVFTVDGTPGVDGVDARLSRLKIEDGVATLLASERFVGRDAHDVRYLDGYIAISHAERWTSSLTLDVVNLSDLSAVSSTAVNDGLVTGAAGSHLLYGTWAVSLLDPAQPLLRQLGASSWRRQSLALDGSDVLMIAAGRSGLVVLD